MCIEQDRIVTHFEHLQSNGEYYEAERNHTENPTPPLNLNVTDYLSQYCYDATWAFALVLNKTIEGLCFVVYNSRGPDCGIWCDICRAPALTTAFMFSAK